MPDICEQMTVGHKARPTNGDGIEVSFDPIRGARLRAIAASESPASGLLHGNANGCRGGFTLLEVLLVLALIGSLAAVFVVGIQSVARTTPGDALESAFWSAMRDAKDTAVRDRVTQSISFDAEELEFVVEGGGHLKTSSVNLDVPVDSGKIEAVFTQVLPTNSFTLVRGRLVTEREIDMMLVFPDGTCQPVTVEFRFPGGPRRISIDPWTCAELLDAEEEGRR